MSDQAETQSQTVQERVANIMGDQPPDSQAQQVENTAPEFEEVEYEGELFQVPPKLKKGLMLNDDYTRKTQEVSESRKSLEIAHQQLKLTQQQQAFRQQAAEDYEQVKLIENYLKQPVDWEGMSAEQMFRKRAEIDQLKDRKNDLQQSLAQREHEFGENLKKQLADLGQKSREVLAREITGWNDATEKDVKDWAVTQGITSEELAGLINPVHMKILHKARQYDKLVANKEAAVQQASKASPMAKPTSSNPMPQAVKDRLNFRKAVAKATPSEKRKLVEQRAAQIFS